MTQSNLGARAVYSGSGSAGPFSLVDASANPIQFDENTELVVTRFNTALAGSVLTLTTDYTLSGAGSTSAGALTLTSALTAGFLLSIERAVPLTQTLDMQFGGTVSLEDLEETLDRLTRITQDLDQRLDRAALFYPHFTGSSYYFEAPEDGGFLAWDTSSRTITSVDQPALLLSGSGAPSDDDGDTGDFYLDYTNMALYGPKTGSWGSGVSLIGPAGSTGATGATGSAGPAGDDGQTILSGSGAPSDLDGTDGDFYIDISAYDIYGPKAGGTWGGATSLVGPSGSGSGDVTGPSGASDDAFVRFDSATGKLLQNSVVLCDNSGNITGVASIRAASAGLLLADTGGDHYMNFRVGENLSADRTFTIILSNADRQLTIGATSSISGTAYVAGSTDVALGDGGTGASLADPNDDRIFFWDDSESTAAFLDIGTGLAVSGTTISLSHLGFQSLTDPNIDALTMWDDTAGNVVFATFGTGVTSSGTTVSLTANQRNVGIPVIIDGGGTTITTGVKAYISMPFTGTITQWDLLADQSGSIIIDIWKDTYANYPPTNADTITNSLEPQIISGSKGSSSSLGSWTTTSFGKDDVFGINVDGATAHTRVTLMLHASKS